jgi:hypothetical protein
LFFLNHNKKTKGKGKKKTICSSNTKKETKTNVKKHYNNLLCFVRKATISSMLYFCQFPKFLSRNYCPSLNNKKIKIFFHYIKLKKRCIQNNLNIYNLSITFIEVDLKINKDLLIRLKKYYRLLSKEVTFLLFSL